MKKGIRNRYLHQSLTPKYNSDNEFQNCPFIVCVSLLRSAQRKPTGLDKIKSNLETTWWWAELPALCPLYTVLSVGMWVAGKESAAHKIYTEVDVSSHIWTPLWRNSPCPTQHCICSLLPLSQPSPQPQHQLPLPPQGTPQAFPLNMEHFTRIREGRVEHSLGFPQRLMEWAQFGGCLQTCHGFCKWFGVGRVQGVPTDRIEGKAALEDQPSLEFKSKDL